MTEIRGQRSEVISQKSGRDLTISSLLFALCIDRACVSLAMSREKHFSRQSQDGESDWCDDSAERAGAEGQGNSLIFIS
jgi:hypothetical protein